MAVRSFLGKVTAARRDWRYEWTLATRRGLSLCVATFLLVADLKRHGRHQEGVLWSSFQGKVQSVITIKSGYEIIIKSTGVVPKPYLTTSRFHVQPGLAEVRAKGERMVPGHLTGTVAVSSC